MPYSLKRRYKLYWKQKLGGKKTLPIITINGKRYVKLLDDTLAQLVVM